jgi:tetratricopeptide (TPR) repeat protein
MTEMTMALNNENTNKNSAKWTTDDGVNWRSYIEDTRGNYINRYASFAQQFTNNFSRLEEELANLMNTVQQAVIQRAYNTVLVMAESLWSSGGQFLDLQGHMQEGIQLLTQALNAARLLEDKRQEERLLGQLGRAYMALMNWPAAVKNLKQALTIAKEIDNRQGEASHLGNLGQLQLQQENQQKAADHFQEAIKIVREIGERQIEGRLLASLGLVKLRNQMLVGYTWERMIEAIELFKSAIAIAQEKGDRRGEASHFGSLGGAYELMGSKNVSLPPFLGGSPYPGEDAERYERYRKQLEKANQKSYLEAYKHYSHAFVIAKEIGDVQMQDKFDDERVRVGYIVNLPLFPGTGEINSNIWMRNQPRSL